MNDKPTAMKFSFEIDDDLATSIAGGDNSVPEDQMPRLVAFAAQLGSALDKEFAENQKYGGKVCITALAYALSVAIAKAAASPGEGIKLQAAAHSFVMKVTPLLYQLKISEDDNNDGTQGEA